MMRCFEESIILSCKNTKSHNYCTLPPSCHIRIEMSTNLLEEEVEVESEMQPNLKYDESITTIEAFNQWPQWRTNLVMQMFNEWRQNRGLG